MEDQAVLALHNDPREYCQRLQLAKVNLHQVFEDKAVPFIGAQDTVLDIGSATGVVADILCAHARHGERYANDISANNLRWTMGRGFYARYYHGPADDVCVSMLAEGSRVDWAVLISVTYYFSPERLKRLLNTLGQLCQKGIVVTYDGVPQAMADQWSGSIHQRVAVYDHREGFTCYVPNHHWEGETIWSGDGWQGSRTGIKVPCDMVVMRKAE